MPIEILKPSMIFDFQRTQKRTKSLLWILIKKSLDKIFSFIADSRLGSKYNRVLFDV